jgi:transaldolase
MTDQLTALKSFTTVVADSGDFASFATLKPQDATTNPSLILTAASQEKYSHLIDIAVKYSKDKASTLEEQVAIALDVVAVTFGSEILKIIPGRVSTEIDARLSYDTKATIAKCRTLYALYEEIGVNPKERVLFKIASTWEGIQAAKQLEQEGIKTNLTLMFGFPQAVACAEAGVFLVSPFVGRITDFWKKEKNVSSFDPEEDPGVISVRGIYSYYKKYGYKTIVMGASFRSKEQVLALAGCDYLTIAPNILQALQDSHDPVKRMMSPEDAAKSDVKKESFDEKSFRYNLGKDLCATYKLAEGINSFAQAAEKLEQLLKQRIQS